MGCSIQITSVQGQGVINLPATSIKVVGTVQDCFSGQIILVLNCPGGTKTEIVNVNPSGPWEFEFTGTDDLQCICGGTVSITAQCDGAPSCKDVWPDPFTAPVLPCPACCPKVLLSYKEKECVGNKREVELKADIKLGSGPDCDTLVVEWHYGDGFNGPAFVVASNGIYTDAHEYDDIGPYPAYLKILSPVDCPGVNMLVGPLQSCAQPCPELSLTAEIDEDDWCAGAGKSAKVKFTATLTPPTPGFTFTWDMDDPSSPGDFESDSPVDYVYAQSGSYSVSVAAISDDCHLVESIIVTIPPCCPVITGLQAFVGAGCADSINKSVNVTFLATLDPPGVPGTYTWDFGDGAGQSTSVSTTDHPYTVPGNYTVTVSFLPDDTDCATEITNEVTSVVIPSCPPTTGGGGNGNGDNGGCGCCLCEILLALATFLLFIAVAAAIAGGCGVAYAIIISIVAFVLAIVVFIIWFFLCGKSSCKTLNSFINFLEFLVLFQGLIIAALAAAGSPCALGALLGGFYLGSFLALAEKMAKMAGCLIEKP